MLSRHNVFRSEYRLRHGQAQRAAVPGDTSPIEILNVEPAAVRDAVHGFVTAPLDVDPAASCADFSSARLSEGHTSVLAFHHVVADDWTLDLVTQ
ncbi:hypothetical protein AB0C29_02150 [Actinoplanes sp. NPDC048791]|uniref:hypothetical protein n=1 Tax=Actinoplanes sp. NPDC048791 TaxID=3154623 RepID=UPI0033D74D35